MTSTAILHMKQLTLSEAQEFDIIRRMVVSHAKTQYSYTISDDDVREILYSGYWGDVDEFCLYMQEVNFGSAVPGTTNVELPSTMTIYSDDELDAMDARLGGNPAPVISGLGIRERFETEDELESDDESDYEDEYGVEDDGPYRHMGLSQTDMESPETNDGTLPLYSQVCAAQDQVLLTDEPPCYDDDFTQEPPVFATYHTEPGTDTKDFPAGQENLIEVEVEHNTEPELVEVEVDLNTGPESDGAHSHRGRLGRKLLKVRQKFARGVKSVHPRSLTNGVSRIKGMLRRADR